MARDVSATRSRLYPRPKKSWVALLVGGDRADRLRRGLLVALLLAGGVVFATIDRADPDLWGHVRYGQDVLASGRLPATATYTYTAPAQPWINHENLSEIVFAFMADHAGGTGLAALKCLLGLTLLGLMIAGARRRGGGIATTAVAVLLVTFATAPGWSFRPQLFTYTFFGVVVFILDRVFADGQSPPADTRLLWLLPPLFTVWANTHGGFVAGLGVLALYLGCRAAERLCAEGRRGLAPAALYGGVALASALATLLNPYGLDLLTWLVRDLGPPRPEIFEWRALSPSDAVFPIFVIVLGLTATAWLARRQWRDPARTVLLAATAWQCVAHVRHLPFFAIAAGFWLPAQLQPLVDRMRHATDRSTASGPRRAGWAAWGVWAVDLGLAALLAVHVRGPLVERSVYPVNAFRYMAKRRLTGRVVVHFDWAQYAIAAFGDDAPVAFDGRLRTCYPQEVADAYFDFLVGDRLIPRWRSEQSPPVDATRVLRLGDPDLAVVARHFTHSVEVMEARADWVLLYQDAVAQLWGRRDRYGDAASPDYLPPAQRWITEVRQVGSVPWPALPPRRVVASAARPAVAAAHAAGAG